MTEATIGANKYRIGKLNAKQQWHVARRLTPMLAAAAAAEKSLVDGSSIVDLLLTKNMAEAISKMSDADSDYITDTCLAVCQREQPGGLWSNVVAGGNLMFADMTMPDMMQLTKAVITENLGGFFPGGGPGAEPPPTGPKA